MRTSALASGARSIGAPRLGGAMAAADAMRAPAVTHERRELKGLGLKAHPVAGERRYTPMSRV